MTITPLSAEEIRQTGFTHKIAATYADFTGEATTVAFELWPKLTTSSPTFGAGFRVNDAAVYIPTIFVAASMTDLLLDIGDDGDVDRIIDGVEIGGTTSPISAGTWYDGPPANLPHTYSAANTLDIILTATGADLSALTAGVLTIYLSLTDLSTL
jgi:hypothetical protein